jgi:hypothetical protein
MLQNNFKTYYFNSMFKKPFFSLNPRYLCSFEKASGFNFERFYEPLLNFETFMYSKKPRVLNYKKVMLDGNLNPFLGFSEIH